MKRKAFNYEDYLTDEQKQDLYIKLVAFWQSVIDKYPYKTYLNNLGKYKKRAEQ